MPFLVGGSTHPGEEEALLQAWQRLRATRAPELRLVLVPRHPERVPEVVRTARRNGARAGLRSQGAADADVVVVDSVGELASLYHLAELAFVGGSLSPIGCLLGEAKQVTRPMESDDLSFAIAERMADPDQPRAQQVNETRLVALRENQRAGGPEVDDLRQPPEFSPFRCGESDMRRLFTVSMRPAMGRPYANVGVSAAARVAQSRHGQVSASPGRGLGKRLSTLV